MRIISEFTSRVALAGVILVSALTAASATTALFDGDFTTVTATPTFTTDPTGSTASASVCVNCGNPGATIQTTFDATTSTAVGSINSTIGVVDNLLSYNPAVQGAIISIDASISKDLIFSGGSPGTSGNGFRPMIKQGVNYYAAFLQGGPPFSIPGTSGWLTLSGSNLTANNFILYDFSTGTTNGTMHPDFAGDEILFGILSVGIYTAGAVSTAYSDNLSFTVNQTPLPAALPLFATGLSAFGLLGWYRKRKAQAAA
jgi:hypothetical protein